MKVVYIAGLGRSGSTLLARMLGQSPDVVSVGELHHIWKTGAPNRSEAELCGCGSPFAECPFWNAVIDSVFGETTPDDLLELRGRVDRIRYVPRMLRSAREGRYALDLERYRGIVARLYAALDSVGGGRTIVDATKDLSPLFLLSTIEDLDVHVVHLIRDVRGVAHSWAQRKRRPEFVGREVLMNRHRPLATAGRWLYSNFLAERAGRRHASYLRLRYEDLVEEPVAALEAIRASAGLEAMETGFLEGRTADLRRDNHTLSGNPMRFRTGPIELVLDEAWRREMPALGRWATGLVAWPQLVRYGYLGAR